VTSNARKFLADPADTGSGEMAALIRAFDWSANPLGPPEQWPASLKAMVRLALSTPHPVFIFWGPQQICLYNDGFRASLGPEKHPSILGVTAELAWAESWAVVGAQIDQVIRGGGATWHENQLVPILRHGAIEPVYWTYSYCPIDDESAPGGIGGVLVLCTETTEQVLAKRRLASERERFAMLFDQAPSFMAMLQGPEHIFEMANPAYMALIGRRPIIGRRVADAVPEAVSQGFIELLDNVFRTGQAHSAHGVRIAFQPEIEGSVVEREVDFVYQPIFGGDGAVTGIFVDGIDTTERRATAQALAISDEQLRLATDAAGIGLWDFDVLTSHLYWSDRVREVFGIEPGVPVTIADFYAGLHADDLAYAQAAFIAALDPAQRVGYDVEYRTVGKDDGRIRWVAAKGRGMFSEDGICTRAIGTTIDISHRKEEEQFLRHLNQTLERRVAESMAEKRLLADVVEGTEAFVQVVGLDYRWLAINKAAADEFQRIFGVRPRVGDHMLEILAARPAQREQVGAVWARALAGEEFVEVDQVGDPALDRRYYEMRFSALKDKDGRRIGAYQFVYDVTDRLRDHNRLMTVEAALRQSQKMEAIGQLTGGIAHDFNNLLQAVRGSFELIRRNAADPTKVLSHAERGTAASDRGARLTAQLLTFSREQELEMRVFSVRRLLAAIQDLVRTTVGPTLNIAWQVNGEDMWISADPTQFEMAVLNLAINARDALEGRHGELTIALRAHSVRDDPELAPGEYVELRVADDGPGMPAHVAARAFDPFFTTKGVGKGSGLGLSQVYGMAKRVGGTARIETQPGQGTTVALFFRRAEIPHEASPSAAPAAGHAHAASGTTVLVIDDDADVRQFLLDALQSLGHATLAASDGASGLEALARGGVDAIVVDFAMPGMTGAEVARRARLTHPLLPILMVSGYSDSEAIESAVGADTVLIRKPFDIAALSHSLAVLMAKARVARP
jgi:PAS domain S-box-containing protein